MIYLARLLDKLTLLLSQRSRTTLVERTRGGSVKPPVRHSPVHSRPAPNATVPTIEGDYQRWGESWVYLPRARGCAMQDVTDPTLHDWLNNEHEWRRAFSIQPDTYSIPPQGAHTP